MIKTKEKEFVFSARNKQIKIDKDNLNAVVDNGKHKLSLKYKTDKTFTVNNDTTKITATSSDISLHIFSLKKYIKKTRKEFDKKEKKEVEREYIEQQDNIPKGFKKTINKEGIEYALVVNKPSGNIFKFELNFEGDLLHEVKDNKIKFYIDPRKQRINFEKVYQVEQPIVYDSKGNETKAEIKYDGKELIIIIDEKWLEKAVYPIVIDPTITFGSEYVFNSGTTHHISICSLDSTHVVVAYQDAGNSNYGTAIVGTISGSSISFGSEYVFNSGSTQKTSICSLDSTHIVIAYEDIGNSNYGTAIVGTISGSSISFGSEYVFNSEETDYIAICSLDSSHFIIIYNDIGGDVVGKVIAGSVSGTTITFGSAVECNDDYDEIWDVSIDSLDSSHFVASFQSGSDDDGIAFVGSVSGTTITIGSNYTFQSSIQGYIDVCSLDSTHFVVSFSDGSYHGSCVVGTVSGTTISFGSIYVFNSALTSYKGICSLDSTHFVVAYVDYSNSEYGTAIKGTVSGTTISYDEEDVFNSDNTTGLDVCSLSLNKITISYENGGNSYYGTAIVGTTTITYPPTIEGISTLQGVNTIQF